MDDPEISRANRMARRTVENQVIGRGSRKLANTVTAYGAYLQTKPYSTVQYTHVGAKYNPSGKVVVAAHTQRTHIPTKSEGGRGFYRSNRARHGTIGMGRTIVWGGRLIPVLGYGYIAYNMYRDPVATTQDMASPGIATSTESMAYRVTRDSWKYLQMQMQNASRSNSPAARGYQARGGVL